MTKSQEWDTLVQEVLSELQKRLNGISLSEAPRKKILVLGPLPTEAPHTLDDRYTFLSPVDCPDTEEADLVLVTKISVSLLAQTALGCPVVSEAGVLLQALLLGKPVYLLESGMEYRKYRDTAPKILYQLYQQYENTLVHLGVRILPAKKEFLKTPISTFAQMLPSPPDFTHCRVLTEAEVQKARKSGTLLIGTHTLITPLARDYIETHKLKILRQ